MVETSQQFKDQTTFDNSHTTANSLIGAKQALKEKKAMSDLNNNQQTAFTNLATPGDFQDTKLVSGATPPTTTAFTATPGTTTTTATSGTAFGNTDPLLEKSLHHDHLHHSHQPLIGHEFKEGHGLSSTHHHEKPHFELNAGTSLGQHQGFHENYATTSIPTQIIEERPVLDRVEKIVQKEVVQKPLIQEQFRQEIIEVHEKPIEKRFVHPVQEFRVQEQTKYEIEGREFADLERQKVIEDIRLRDRNHKVHIDQHQDVRVIQQAPTTFQSKEIRKEVIYKPVVTEIHEQPIREIHEQYIQRTIYQKPIVTVVRDQALIENIGATQPLPDIGTFSSSFNSGMNLGHSHHTTHNIDSSGIHVSKDPYKHKHKHLPLLQQQQPSHMLRQPQALATDVVVEKGATDVNPKIIPGVQASNIDTFKKL